MCEQLEDRSRKGICTVGTNVITVRIFLFQQLVHTIQQLVFARIRALRAKQQVQDTFIAVAVIMQQRVRRLDRD